MDTGTPATAERDDSEMEAVGEIDGAEDSGRKGEDVSERLQGPDPTCAARDRQGTKVSGGGLTTLLI